jgi:hypothetical protein
MEAQMSNSCRHGGLRQLLLAFFALASACVGVASAEEAAWHGPGPAKSPADVRAGGVLATSYGYHRQAHVASPMIAHAGGWYGYGFPVQTYRWGWFGAERYYPTVHWFRGYYGDCVRYAYRRGY